MPGLHPARRRSVRGRRGAHGRSGSSCVCRPSACRRRSGAGSASTRRERHDGEEFNAFVDRVGHGSVRATRRRSRTAGRVQRRDDQRLHRLEPDRALPGHARRGRMRGLSIVRPRCPDRGRAAAAPRICVALHARAIPPAPRLACSFQKEETVLLDMLLRLEPTGAGVHDRHGCPVSRRPAPAWRQVEERYGITRRGASTRADPAARRGRPSDCCGERKVAALDQALADSTAGSPGCGASRQSTRADTPKLAWDARRGVWKASPLPTGPRSTSGPTSPGTTFPTTRYTITATTRSGARRARCPGSGREGRWAGLRQDRMRPARHRRSDPSRGGRA